MICGRAHLDIDIHHSLGHARLWSQVHLQLEAEPLVQIVPAQEVSVTSHAWEPLLRDSDMQVDPMVRHSNHKVDEVLT